MFRDDFSIAELIPRILLERKSFLNLTEDSLQKEIEDGHKDDEMELETSDELEGALKEAAKLTEDETEKLQNIKVDLTKNINLALNETSLSLDLVSLLLSSSKPNLAKSTISPHLSKNVPLGSLNSDRLAPEENAPNDNVDTNKIGQGWKYESLSKIRDLFANKKEKLQLQVSKETTYWNLINEVLDENEVLIKLRDPLDNSKAIGVKYGYGDSGSSFHDKGIAILRRDAKSGEVSFNPMLQANNKLITKTFKHVRVKILSKVDDEYMLTGQSKFELNFNKSTNNRLINDIERARYFIFEEDLFHQLTREARTLINYNVLIISDKIIIEINNDIIEIESVNYDETDDDELKDSYQNINDESTKNDAKCQLILNYLKIMLCGYFKYNLSLKQKIPTNFTKFKQNNSHPLILRPLLGNIKHESYIAELDKSLKQIIDEYSGKIECEKHLKKFANIKGLTKLESPFIKSIEKPLSQFNVTVKNLKNGKYLNIDVDITSSEIFVNLILHLKIIRFDTIDDLTTNEKGTNVLQLTFNDFAEIGQCIDWSIQKFLLE